MKIPFYFKLRISAGMIENIIKQEIPHLSLQPLEALKCLKTGGFFVTKEMLVCHFYTLPYIYIIGY